MAVDGGCARPHDGDGALTDAQGRRAEDPSGARPLAGIRVCDVTQNLAGPFCGQILADLGADVVKVEPPGGDLGRAWGPPFWGDDSTLFLSANRGKRSIGLDLKSEGGRAVLRRLVEGADVFLQASRPGAAERLGIDAATLRARRPDLVHLSITAYGPDGPMRDQPGYDPLMQAYAGIMSVTGAPEGPPARVGGSVVDFGTGMWAAIAVLSALRVRDATGEGATLDTSLMDTALGWVSYHMMGYLATGEVPGRMGSALGAIAPYRAFATTDGGVMIAAGNDAIFRRLCAALDLGPLAEDPRYGTNADRVAHRAELDDAVEARTRALSSVELLERMHAHGVPASAIQSIDQVVADEQVAAADMLRTTPHDRSRAYRDVSLPLRVDGARPRAERAPPGPGAHTAEILAELGYDEDEVAALLRSGAAFALFNA